MLQPDMDGQHVEVRTKLCPAGRAASLCFNSVLTAFLFSFSLLPMGAQEISLLLVSRVSLLCGHLLSGEVGLESSFLPLFSLETLLGGRGLHTVIIFLS